MIFPFFMSEMNGMVLFMHSSLSFEFSKLSFLQDNKSARAEEFRLACDEKFELSTIFKSADEKATLKKEAIAAQPEPPATNGIEDSPAHYN